MEKLKRYDLNCNIFDVYNYEGLSMQELLCQFYTKINECVDFSNSTLDLCEWLVNEGLNLEVATKLTTWLNDGTLENIINVSLFENLNKKIDSVSSQLNHITNYINPDIYEGSDIEKLQKAIDECVKTNKDCEIRLHRMFNITGGTLYLNRDKDGEKQFYKGCVKIIGVNGGITKSDNGYFFSSNDLPNYEGSSEVHYTGDLVLRNLSLIGSEQRNVCLIDGDKLIRVYIQDNDINYIGCLVKSSTYTQSMFILRNKIRYGLGTLLDTENNYDLNFNDNIVEWCENFFKFSGANGCRFNNNLVEGIKGYTVVAKNGCQSLSFDNNYFELNNSYFDLTNLKGYGFTLKNSYVHDNDNSKTFVKLPINQHGNSAYQDQYTFISNTISGGIKMYDFEDTPKDEVKILSIGCNGGSRNYNNRIQHAGVTFSETNGTIKSYYKDGVKCITNKSGVTFHSDTVTTVEIDMGETIRLSDIISVKLIDSTGSFDLVQVLNVYPIDNIVKVAIKGSGKYVGDIYCTVNVTVLKTPFTQWF